MPIILNIEKISQRCHECSNTYSFEFKKRNLVLYTHVEEDYANKILMATTRCKIDSFCPYCGAKNTQGVNQSEY